MQAFVTYLHDSPLEWRLDRTIRSTLGENCVVFFGFLDQSDGERALQAAPQLFDLDQDDALGLQLSAIEIPSATERG